MKTLVYWCGGVISYFGGGGIGIVFWVDFWLECGYYRE